MKKQRRRFSRKKKIWLLVALLAAVVLLTSGCATAGDTTTDGILSGVLGMDSQSRSESVNILLMLTLLSLLPSLLIMMTSFTRIIIVLSLIRNALGTQQMPPNQVLIGLALFLSFFVMAPVINTMTETAYEPYVAGEITQDEAVDRAMVPIREFMMRQTYKSDLNFFIQASGSDVALDTEEDYAKIPNSTLIPAFVISEIKQGFEIGFFIYIPFIVIDMIVASTLMAMGMMMLPPVIISLPFKLLLFVLVDGWGMTVRMLFSTFR